MIPAWTVAPVGATVVAAVQLAVTVPRTTKRIRALRSLKSRFRRPTLALHLRPEPFLPIQGSLRRSETEDHDVTKTGVVAPAAAVVKAERSANRLAAASRTSKAQQDLIDRDGPRRFASYSDGNRRPSPRLIVPRKETKTENRVDASCTNTRSAKSP